MNRLNRHRLEMLERIMQFAADHPEVLARNARVAALFAAVAPMLEVLRGFGVRQVSGHRIYRSGAEERSVVADRLRKALRKIYRIVQVLDPAEHPGVREKFRMPVDSYRALADSARAFVKHAEPLAHLFVERGRPANFLGEIEGLVAALEEAGQRKHHGRLAQVGGTAGIETEARRGVRVMRELDAILCDLLEEDESLLAAWRTAARLERNPEAGVSIPSSELTLIGTDAVRNGSEECLQVGSAAETVSPLFSIVIPPMSCVPIVERDIFRAGGCAANGRDFLVRSWFEFAARDARCGAARENLANLLGP